MRIMLLVVLSFFASSIVDHRSDALAFPAACSASSKKKPAKFFVQTARRISNETFEAIWKPFWEASKDRRKRGNMGNLSLLPLQEQKQQLRAEFSGRDKTFFILRRLGSGSVIGFAIWGPGINPRNQVILNTMLFREYPNLQDDMNLILKAGERVLPDTYTLAIWAPGGNGATALGDDFRKIPLNPDILIGELDDEEVEAMTLDFVRGGDERFREFDAELWERRPRW